MPIRRLYLSLLLILLWTASAIAEVVEAIPLPDSDAPGWAKALYEAVTTGEWKLAGGLLLLGLTFALRTWGARVLPWFASTNGGVALALAISLAATFGLALASGAAITLGTVLAAAGTAATAAGLWEWFKRWIPGLSASNEKTKAKAEAKAASSP